MSLLYYAEKDKKEFIEIYDVDGIEAFMKIEMLFFVVSYVKVEYFYDGFVKYSVKGINGETLDFSYKPKKFISSLSLS